MIIRKLRKMAAITTSSSLLLTLLFASGVPSIAQASAAVTGGAEMPEQKTGNWDDLKFNWTTPASGTDFNGAPVGNGYFGAKVSGGVASEVLQLSDKTFHSGEPFDNYVPARQTALNTTRSLLAEADTATTVTYREDKLKLAETAASGMWGSVDLANFLPIGKIVLDVPNTTGYTNYNRELHLDKSMVTTKYKVGDTTYTREVFASNPDRVMVIRITNDSGQPMSMTAKLTLPAEMNTHGTVSSSGSEIQMTGTAPYDDYASQWATGRGMTFDARLRARTTGGTIIATGGNLNIANATVIELLYADATSYKDPFTNPNPSQGGNLPGPIVTGIMDAAFAKTYTQLLDAHQTDYRSLFRRLWTEVNGNSGSSRPYTLTYQYARYVSIAASRANTFDRPFNENGMWQKEWRPTNYGAHFFNENVEKMYALIETGNLSENGDPLWKYIQNLAINGAKTAQTDFGFHGWMVPHASDVWAKTELSSGDNEWAIWPTGGMWLMFNVYDHYRFTHDVSFLRDTAFPLMKGSAEFALDLLVTNKDGYLVTSPSTSPETKYVLSDSRAIAVSQGSTIDMTVIRELFENILEAGSILEADSPADVDLLNRIQIALPKLLPYQIGSSGEIKEWNNDYSIVDPSHRHASHLIGVGFLDQITKRDTPDLFNAAKVSLDMRGSGGYHPDSAYMRARLYEGDKALALADIYPTGQYVNEYQVKGAYYPELFVQSQVDNIIDILPALPSTWTTGNFSGIKARGGFEVGVSWTKSRATSIQVKSLNGTRAKLSYLDINGASVVDQNGTPVTYTVVDNNQIEFNTTVGSTYTISAITAAPPSPTIVKVDDRDASVTYSGAWSTYDTASDYMGTEKYAGTAGNYAQFTFTGTSIKFISMKQPNMGIADVYLDGVLDQANIDMYAPSANKQAVVYTKTGLSNTAHTIRVVAKGTKNAASSGTYVGVDAFEYLIPALTLSDLRVNGTTLDGFVSDKIKYSLSVPYETTVVSVVYTASDPTATVMINGGESLAVGDNSVIVTVTAQDGNQTVYSILVTRHPFAASTDSSLIDLRFNGTTLEGFAPDKLIYSLSVPYETTVTRVVYTASDPKATVMIHGGESLAVGDNTVTVTVTAEDGTQRVYSIVITRQPAALSSNANLLDLRVNTIAMNGFAPNKLSYTMDVPFGTTEAKVTYSAEHDTSNVVVTGGSSLSVGSNRISILVTAQDGTSKEYVIIVNRLADSSQPSGTSTTPVKPELPKDTASIKDEDLQKNSASVPVTLAEGQNRIIVPMAQADQLQGRSLIVQAHDVKLIVPGDLLKSAGSLLPSTDDSTITVKIEPISAVQADRTLQEASRKDNGQYTLGGQVLDLSIIVTDAAGKQVEMNNELKMPVTITFPIPAGLNPKLVGIYEIQEDGSLVYVGGTHVNDNTGIEVKIDHLSQFALISLEKNYNDITSKHWAFETIQELSAQHIVNGITNSSYEPTKAVSRAEFATLLVRTLGLKSAETAPFGDVDGNAWYAKEVSAAYKAGIITGDSQQMFDPNLSITREQMAIMLVRAYELRTGVKLEQASPEISDASEISDWALPYVNRAINAKLLTGRQEGLFVPAEYMTRAEAAQAVYNLLK